MSRPSLEPLLALLRARGLFVGIDEVLRLREVFRLEPTLDEEALRHVLASVLVKSPAQRVELDRAFHDWLGEADAILDPTHARPAGVEHGSLGLPIPDPHLDVVTSSGGGTTSRSWPRWIPLAAALATAVAAAVIYLPGVWPGLGGSDAGDNGHLPGDSDSGVKPDTAEPGARPISHRAMMPVLEVVTPDRTTARIGFVGGCAALVLLVFIWGVARPRSSLAPPATSPARPGPAWGTLAPLALTHPVFLGPQDEEAVIWGIGRFVSEEPTRRLDVVRTVETTARAGGLPHLVFEMERFHRTVSLWVDDGAEDPAARRLAAEVQSALASVGLPSQQATFWGIPERLRVSDGTEVSPADLEEASQSTVVLVLTDGRLLGRHHQDSVRGPFVRALLRRLATWPRLAFVDFSSVPGELEALLRPYEITLLAPRDIAAFLATDAVVRASGAPREGQALRGDALAWAAATALVPHPIDEPTAFALRSALHLEGASPWTVQILRRMAPGPGDTLEWHHSDRCALLRWLAGAESPSPGGTIAPASLLGRALAFWQARYRDEATERRRREHEEPWTGTTAERRLETLHRLLQLWSDPDGATPALAALAGGAEGEELRRRLAVLAPAESADHDGVIVLPWRVSDRPAEVQLRLAQLGFGSAADLAPPPAPRRSGRTWVALGLAAGLAAGAIVSASVAYVRESPGAELVADALPGSYLKRWSFADAAGSLYVVAGSPGAFGAARVTAEWPPASSVQFRWGDSVVPCDLELPTPGLVRVLHCAPEGAPPTPAGDTAQYVILLAGPADPGALALAEALLATRSASTVFLAPRLTRVESLSLPETTAGGPRWAIVGPREGWPNLDPAVDVSKLVPLVPEQQWALFVPGESWELLEEKLRFTGERPLEDVWPEAELRGLPPGSFILRGTGDTPVQHGDPTGAGATISPLTPLDAAVPSNLPADAGTPRPSGARAE